MTEIFDHNDEELGSDYVERAIRTMPDQPLREMAARIIATGQQFGPARDDRTLLLIRVTADLTSLDHQQEVACGDAIPLSH